MITLHINQQKIEVEQGTSLLMAAKMTGISIPTLCFLEDYPYFTSCMICVVQERKSGKLLPSCSAQAEHDMIIETDNADVHHARKTALELLLSEHVGDCESPCQRACPAHINIPLMLQQVYSGKQREALITIKNHLALPAVIGSVCHAPCEKGCRRVAIDEAVAICHLQRFIAQADLAAAEPYLPLCMPASGKNIAIIGAGPAGLSAAYYLRQLGHACTIFDDHSQPGGMLHHISPDRLSPALLAAEVDIIRQIGVIFRLDTRVGIDIDFMELCKNYDAIIVAGGNSLTGKLPLDRYGVIISHGFKTNFENIFAAGAMIRPTKHAVVSTASGRSLAIVVQQYVNNETLAEHPHFNSRIGRLLEEEISYFREQAATSPTKSGAISRLEPATLTAAQAATEAERCLHCECLKSESCKLRQYAANYQADARAFRGSERRKIEKLYHPSSIIYESGKCIKCGLCVRITERHQERLGLTFIGRGFDLHIGVPLNKPLAQALEKTAHQCVQACPTGALAFQRYESPR